jgi:DNA modification methylase
VLAQFPEGSVDLIYVDPPFFSNRQYEVLWGDGYELRAFEDRWKGGIENYIVWMEDKLRECHRVLKDTGSLYLHCDWHANAHLRILIDNIFGEKNFRNEIVWVYSRATSPKQKLWGRMHDTIFFYTKSDKWTFNVDEVRLPYAKSSEERKGYAKFFHKKGDLESGKCELNQKGKFPEDWWDIPFIRPNATERLGYPTQKPEKLLERIIKASSNPTDIVLDPMCGCGTCIAVAHKLGRQWIGIDVSPTACKLMVKRMQKLGVQISEKDIVGMPKTLEEIKAMQPFEFQNWVCEKLLARASVRSTGDMGIDGWLIDGRPLQVKQSENVGRNVIDNFETALRRAKRERGIIVAFSFGKGAYEEVARSKLHNGLDIELKTVEEILKEE